MFKRQQLQQLEDVGLLRKPFTLGFQTNFIPPLLRQIEFDLNRKLQELDQVDNFLTQTMREESNKHKDAITKEYTRRQEKERAEEEERQRLAHEKAERKRVRAELREKARIGQLMERINVLSLNAQSLEEYTPQMKVYDVRDSNGGKDGMYLIGGFAGELIIIFTCLLDYILANPQNQSFMFQPDVFEEYIKDLLLNENFADGILTLNVARDPDQPAPVTEHSQSQEEIKDNSTTQPVLDDEEYMRAILDRENVSDYGLGFFFDINKDLIISRDFIELLYRSIVKHVRTKPKEITPIPEPPAPEEGQEAISDEAKDLHDKKVEAINQANAEAEAFNEQVAKIQSKIRINQREKAKDGEEAEEGALIRLNNYREIKLEETGDANASAEQQDSREA